MLKIDSWPQAIVIIAGLITSGGVLVFLAGAGWSPESIAGMVTLALGLTAGQAYTARKASQVELKTDQQTQTINHIAEQTDGKMAAAISTAVETGIARATANYRREQGIDNG